MKASISNTSLYQITGYNLDDGILGTDGNWRIYPTIANLDRTFIFYLHIQAEGGSYSVSSQMKYYHGCVPEVVIITTNPSLVSYKEFIMNEPAEKIYEIAPANWYPNYCRGEYDIVEEYIGD